MVLTDKPVARVIFAASEANADLLYATGFFVPDPFWYIRDNTGATHIILSALEVDRGRRSARVDHVHEWSALLEQCQRSQSGLANLSDKAAIACFLRVLQIERFVVPHDFPVQLADYFRAQSFEVLVQEEPFWPERACKRPEEVAAIVEALRLTAQAITVGIDCIAAATIGQDGLLYWRNQPLSSERVRGEIHAFLVRNEAVPQRTIVAGGRQGADPHEVGSGPLPAHQPIILDVFPRMMHNGYWGDMTRTVCRGQASERCQRAWQAVKEAQELACSQIRHQADGHGIHNAVIHHLNQAGFRTGRTAEGLQEGFFHGTGHGVGLEIHELPRISARPFVLQTGQVVTVEPGLYYPDMGGIRLEDVVLVEEHGCRMLSDLPKFLTV
ncbi:MAG: M24 family metallopeptidase [Magnetococcales bacterium]|nr:M24 family metallopeptidase [Magnetococcales bacterium]MBF0114828.1 M24 family metallopeptidase [Magnetococcales bacterium]